MKKFLRRHLILSQAIAAAHRRSPYDSIAYAMFAAYAGNSMCGGFFMGEYGRIWENMGILAACVRRISGRYSAWAADAAKCCRLAVPCVLLPVRSGNRPSAGFARHPILSHTLSYSPISIVRHTGVRPTTQYRQPTASSPMNRQPGSAIGQGRRWEMGR